MALVPRENLKKSNAEVTHYLGVVVDNKDPEFKGRAKVKVFGIFDDLNNEEIPWAHQRFEMSYGETDANEYSRAMSSVRGKSRKSLSE